MNLDMDIAAPTRTAGVGVLHRPPPNCRFTPPPCRRPRDVPSRARSPPDTQERVGYGNRQCFESTSTGRQSPGGMRQGQSPAVCIGNSDGARSAASQWNDRILGRRGRLVLGRGVHAPKASVRDWTAPLICPGDTDEGTPGLRKLGLQ